MTVTVPTKDIGEVKERRGGEFKNRLEDYQEEYIKREMRVE